MSEKRYDYLIIGNSVAGVAAVEAIRDIDKNAAVAIVSDQQNTVYSPPLITYVLGGKIPEDRLQLRTHDFYNKLGVTAYLGVEATNLDTAAHEITLANGMVLGYGKLLLATGGVPIVPDMPGKALDGVFTFTRYEDMCRVRDFVGEKKPVQAVVVGGGMIGVKVAEALRALELDTTIVELSDRILGLALDEYGSQMARRTLEAYGIRVISSTAVTSIGGADGRVQNVTLDSGSHMPAQIVIMAVGVRPNAAIAEEAGIRVNRGIVVDEQMQTSVADVFAAGDVAEAYDPLLGEARPVAIWPNAFMQGEVAGLNMVGQNATYAGNVPMNSIQVCGLPTISVGLIAPPTGADTLEYRSPDGSKYRRMFIVDDHIVGAVFVGDVDRAGIITGLIRNQINVASFREKLMQRDLGLLSLPKQYRKHMVSGPGIEV